MAPHPFRTTERRRTARIVLALPLQVHTQTIYGESVTLKTESHTINKFGCLLLLEAEVCVGQKILLTNENTRKSVEARIVTTRSHPDGRRYSGVEGFSSEP